MAEPKNEQKEVVSVRLSPDVAGRIEEMARRESRTRSNMIELILRDFFDRGGELKARQKNARK